MATLPRLYIDSCCFIDAVSYKIGMTLDRERLVDVSYTNGLLQAALDKKIEILTSTLTIAECLYAGDRNDPVSDEVKNLFRSILESGKIVFLINADYFVMQRARDLRWTDGLQLGGADGIHVASAKEQKCTEFITVDGKIAERNDPDAFKSFGVHVIRPSKTIHLPTNYENMDLFAGDTPQ